MGTIVTGKVRFSYFNVFEARATLNGDLKYSLVLLIPKSDVDTKQRIDAEINRVVQESLAEKFKGVMPANLKTPLHDGDGLKQDGTPYGLECKGCWVMSASSNNAPEVVDANCNPIISKNDLYSGCYGRVSIRLYAYNQNGNKGVGCGLGNVQKLEDGQPLDGRTTAADDFGTPVQDMAMPTQPVYQQPMQPATQGYQVDPISGQPVVPAQNFVAGGATVNNIYGVN